MTPILESKRELVCVLTYFVIGTPISVRRGDRQNVLDQFQRHSALLQSSCQSHDRAEEGRKDHRHVATSVDLCSSIFGCAGASSNAGKKGE